MRLPLLIKTNRAGYASHGSATRSAFFNSRAKRSHSSWLPLPFYHIYPQWLHLKLLPILPDASPKKDTDIALSSASIFFRSVLPHVGHRGALAARSARISLPFAICSSHFFFAIASARLVSSLCLSTLNWYAYTFLNIVYPPFKRLYHNIG